VSFRPCFVVPAFDPGPALAETLAGLSPHGLPIYVTDDGSGPETRELLAGLAAANPLVRPARLEANQGKGAAVLDAMRRAAAEGHTHAFQVDADHQHDLGAVPAFLEAAKARPGALVAGYPVYDGSAPLSRRYGRWANHLWVHVNTLSLGLRDSLCGFRIYPLAPALALADRVRLGRGMTFDTDIAVRLHWEGVDAISLPVGVTYPEGGATHFRPWGDTARLVALHAALFLTMAFRFPRLFRARKPAAPWFRVRERGGRAGLRFMLGLHRFLGARAMRAAARVVTPWFFLTAPGARRASLDYLRRLRRHRGHPGEPALKERYAHFEAFTRGAVDTFLAWAGDAGDIPVAFPDFERFQEMRRGGRGALFLGAHLGALQMIRAMGAERGLTGLNAVVYSENAVRFHDVLRRANPSFNVDLVQVSQVDPLTAIALQEKIDRGESLFIVGDRVPPAEAGRTVDAPFLGAPAPFPLGPYLLAHLLRCPVYLLFCRWDGTRYQVTLEPFADRIALPRKGREEALAQWAARYARSLEAKCLETPLEWFNFFDFWSSHPRP